MTIQEIKEFLEANKENKEVVEFTKSLQAPLTADTVKGYLENEGKEIARSITDSAVTKAIESWKKNNLDKEIEKLYNQKHPAETPEQKELREIKQKMNDIENEKKRDQLKLAATKKLTEKKLPLEVLDHLNLGDSEETLNSVIESFEKIYTGAITSAVEDKIKGNSRTPRTGESNPTGLTAERIGKMTTQELMDNKDKINEYMRANNN